MKRILRILAAREAMLFVVLAVLCAGFAWRVEGFLDAYNILERSRYWVAMGLMAVPMTFLIATSGIDLSVGSILALCGVVTGMLYDAAGWPIGLALMAGLGTGLAAGAFNGFIGSYIGVPPLVVTLATMVLFRGIAMGISRAQAAGNFPEWFLWLGQGDAFQLPFTGEDPVFVPFSLLVMLAVFALGIVLLRKSWIGRFTELLGENETAARFAAIDVRMLKLSLYAAMGLVCGVAAMFHTALYATAKADTAEGMELQVIACVVIGGTRISGGKASVLGTLLGLGIIGMLRFGLEMAGVQSHLIIIVVGIVLVFTAVFNEWYAGRKAGERS